MIAKLSFDNHRSLDKTNYILKVSKNLKYQKSKYKMEFYQLTTIVFAFHEVESLVDTPKVARTQISQRVYLYSNIRKSDQVRSSLEPE